MADVWRKRKTAEAWHNCRNCSDWPTSGYDERSTAPAPDEQCDECRSKKANNECS